MALFSDKIKLRLTKLWIHLFNWKLINFNLYQHKEHNTSVNIELIEIVIVIVNCSLDQCRGWWFSLCKAKQRQRIELYFVITEYLTKSNNDDLNNQQTKL